MTANVRRLVLVPAILTLGVTLLRLTGELMRWSERFFSRRAGGAAALVGIAWLMPLFGIYFALRLARMGHGPQNRGKAIGLAVAGLAVVIGLGLLWVVLGLSPVVQVFGIALAAVLGAVVARSGWTLLGNTLLAYGIAARVPVALIMLVAIHANWGTHYELGRPDLPPLAPPILKWFVIGLVPQMFIWIPATILVGTLFGSLAAALVPRPKAA